MPTTIERGGLFRADCPYVAGTPSMPLSWSAVGFVHWSYEPDEVARLLPDNLQADLYGGKAWVGLQFLTVTAERLPGWVSPRSSFDEARLRVCVVDENGLPGLYYLSVDVNRSAMVRWQRRALNLPTFHAKTRYLLDKAGAGTVADYQCHRSDGTTARLRMQVGDIKATTDIDRFLTARWRVILPRRFWSRTGESRWVVNTHDRWLLFRAAVLVTDDDALVASGLPSPIGPGHALWSPGVKVRLSLPRTGNTTTPADS